MRLTYFHDLSLNENIIDIYENSLQENPKHLSTSPGNTFLSTLVIVRPIIYFDTKTENKLVNSTQLCMYLVCIHTILTKTKIIFIAVNTSIEEGAKPHLTFLFWTLLLWLAQSRICVCVQNMILLLCKIMIIYVPRLTDQLLLYKNYLPRKCYYILPSRRHAHEETLLLLPWNTMSWFGSSTVWLFVLRFTKSNQMFNVFSGVLKGRARLL